MASGRMEFHAYSIMQHANFSFAIANDIPAEEVKDRRHYTREPFNLILLHGFTGTDTDWFYGGLAQSLSIQFNLNVFTPAAGNSFYLDKGYTGANWCEYIGKELPQYISDTFRIEMKRENTIIGGLSMGGFGAIHTALSYPMNFSSCIGLSSALIIHEYAGKASRTPDVVPIQLMYDIFGDQKEVETSEKNPEVLYLRLREKHADIPRIYFACGTEDPLIRHNRDFASFLRDNDADHIFEEGPGGHNWDFWNSYIIKGLEALL